MCLSKAVVLLLTVFVFQFPSISKCQCPTELNPEIIYINDNGIDDENCTCLNETSNSTCKTLQHVFDCLMDSWFEDTCIYIQNGTQNIAGDVALVIENFDRIYIIGNHTSEPPMISSDSDPGVISFLTGDLIYFSNVQLRDIYLKFENVTEIFINDLRFKNTNEMDPANISIVDTNGLSIARAEFWFYKLEIDNALNVSIDSSNFTQTNINCTQDEKPSINSTNWIFSGLFFELANYPNSDNVLLTLSGAVNSISFIDNIFQDNTNTGLILLTTLNLVESFIFHENQVMNNINASNGNFAIDLKGNKDCAGVPTVSFMSNEFRQNSGSKCLIGLETCCKTEGYYSNNTFHDNKLAAMTIRTGNDSTHNISFSEFSSNMARNILVNFLTTEMCEMQTEGYTIIAEDLHFYRNTFSVPVEEEIKDPSVMTIQSERVSADSVWCSLMDLNFTNNYGTALTLINVNVTSLLGKLDFIENTGAFGGGMLLDNITLSDEAVLNYAELNFIRNTAKYGGALYIIDNPCFLSSDYCNIDLTLDNNKATVEGNGIYSQELNTCNCSHSITNCPGFKYNDSSGIPPVISGAKNMNISSSAIRSDEPLSAFSGINVALNFSIIDCKGTPVMCPAKVMALCVDNNDDQPPYPCAGHDENGFKFEIEGPVYVELESGFRSINYNLSIGSFGIDSNLQPILIFQCRDNRAYEKIGVTKKIEVKPEKCPYGFNTNPVSNNCECAGDLNSKDHSKQYICDFSSGTICVENGYWAGFADNISREIFVKRCTSINCNSSLADRDSCSDLDGGLSDYVRLDIKGYKDLMNHRQSDDDRCVRDHSGLLCSGCWGDRKNSFDGYWCIDSNECEDWHKPMLIILSIFWPILYGCFILFFIPRTENGVGSFYCTFFFLAVLRQYIKTFSGEFDELTTVATIYASTLLLGTQVLGLLKWCFFDFGGMWVSFYDYLGPVIIFLMLLIIVLLAKKRPTTFLKFQSNPVISISIALVVTFWSLAFTSITLITPLHLPSHLQIKNHTRLEVEPTQVYCKDGHIPVFIVSLVVLVCIACVALVLLFSPILLGCLNRIKPFLDEFHHCYRTEYRWFSGVYFTSWIILSICTILDQTVLFNSILYALLLLHCMCQPYRKAWLNRLDMFYLIDLVVIISLDVIKNNDPKWLYQTLKYITVILPLAFVTGCGIYMVLKVLKTPLEICKMYAARIRRRHPVGNYNSPQEQKRTSDYFEIGESNPLSNAIDRNRTTVTSFVVSSGDSFEVPTNEKDLEREALLFSHDGDSA